MNLRNERIIGTPLLEVLRLDHSVSFRDLLESQEERMITIEEDGEETIVQCEISVIQRESGFISGLVCVLTDVTEQEKIDRERRNFSRIKNSINEYQELYRSSCGRRMGK